MSPFRHGVTLVEFALILPVLISVVLACVDFGRFAYFHITVANAARAGAYFGSFHPYTTNTVNYWNSKVVQAVRDEMQGATGYDPNRLTVPTPIVITENDAYKYRRVRVQVIYQFRTLVSWPGIPNVINLVRVSEMRFVR